MANKLLINEPPIELLPTLATHIGLDEAIVLQQIQYWLWNVEKRNAKNNYKEGRWWTFSTYEEWQESSFPFWSVQKIGRIFRSLEEQGLLVSKQFEQSDWNQRKWYTIDYIQLDMLECIKTEQSGILEVNDLNKNDENYDESDNETYSKGENFSDEFATPEQTELEKLESRLSGAFVSATGLLEPSSGSPRAASWMRGLTELAKMNATPEEVTAAVARMDAEGYTYKSPESVITFIANGRKNKRKKKSDTPAVRV